MEHDRPHTTIERIDDVISDVEALARLHEVRNRCVRTEDDFEGYLETILETAILVAGTDKGILELVDPDTGLLAIRAQRGFERSPLDSISNGRGRTAAPWDDAAGKVQSIPLIGSNRRVFGMISIYFAHCTRLGEREQRFLDLLAWQSADYVEFGQTESLLRRAPPGFETLITQCSRNLRFLFVNRRCAEFFGKPVELIVGHPIWEIFGEAAFEVIRPYVIKVLSGERVEFEAEIPYAAAGLRRVHVVYVPGFDQQAAVCGWVATINDITNRKNLSSSRVPSGRWHIRRAWLDACRARPIARVYSA